MKILVTGASGLVGSALKSITTCEDNWAFLTRKDCDLTSRHLTIGYFNEVRPDCVIHLASYVPGFYNIDKVTSFADNVRINGNVLEAAHRVGVERVMSCLSVNMFPEVPSKFPMDESMIFDGALTGPFSGYAYSKRMIEHLSQAYNSQYGRKYFGIIPCNIYGPNDNMSSGRLIPNLISKFKEAAQNNSDVEMSGSGKPLRQFIYSIDLAKIIKHLVWNYFGNNPVICCGDEEVSVADLSAQIGEIIQFKHQIKFDASKPDGNLRKTVSNGYLKTIMPDVSFTSLRDGLQKTIDSMENV